MVEKRYENRRPFAAIVGVRRRQGPVGTFVSRDVGTNGMFIKIGANDVPNNEVLWIDIPAPLAGGRPVRVMAIVAHRNTEGIGVMFSQPLAAFESPGVLWQVRSPAVDGDPRRLWDLGRDSSHTGR